MLKTILFPSILSALLAGFAFAAPIARAQTFLDASFETPPVANNNFVFEPGGTSWTYTAGTGNSGIANGNGAWGTGAASGQQYAFIQENSSISQTVSNLVPGTQYQLKFAMARRNGNVGGNDVNHIEIDKDGVALNTIKAVDEVWRTYTSTVFTANATSANFNFKGLIASQDVTTLLDAVSIAPAVKSTTILQNSGFEIPNFARGGWNYETNYLDGGGWYFSAQTGGGGAGTASAGSPWGNLALAGNQFAFVQKGGFISQTLQNLIVGQKYYITFEDATRPGFGSHGLRVMVDNMLVLNLISNSNAWRLDQTLPFTATSSSMTLAFDGIDGNVDASSLLDEVRIVQSVPEPSGIALGVGSVLALMVRRRKRRNCRK